MRRLLPCCIAIIILLLCTINLVFAQNIATASTENGHLVDYPANWELLPQDESPSFVGFFNGSMTVRMYVIPAERGLSDPTEWLGFIIEEVEDEDDEIGDFGEIETYLINGQWDSARVKRVRSDNRLIEILLTTILDQNVVFLRATLRIGSQDFFLPVYDDMIASLRHVDDETVITHGSTAQRPAIDGMIGSVHAPLNIGALNTNFITEDELYQFEYPDTWDIRTETDGRITLIDRSDGFPTLFGYLQIAPVRTEFDTTALVSAQFDAAVDVSSFMLHDLPASRVIIKDEGNNVRRIVMATIHNETQVLLDAIISISASDDIDAMLRAMLYSVRHNGEAFTLSASGQAIRTGLLSAGIYGSSRVPSNEFVVEGTVLGTTFVTRNGRFTFNYPSEWYDDFIEGMIVISNDDDIVLFDPSRNDVQAMINFIESPENFLEDNFSSLAVLTYAIERDEFADNWSEVREFSSLDRDAVYSDFTIAGSDLLYRSYMIKLDDLDSVYVRVDMVVDEDDIEEYEPIVLAIIDTIRFQD